MFLFFFFQAEDGIRDLTVTGVQTCALPIWYDSKELSWDATMRRPSPVGHSTRRLRIWTRSGRSSVWRSEEHTSELQSQSNLVCRLLLEKKKTKQEPYVRSTALGP